MLKSFRYFLLPLSILYGAIIWLRNWLFDKNILRSSSFNFPIICVGNLAIGGTGKTPLTEYITTILKNDYKIAIISRGYKRKTKGFAIATENTTAIDIGDEPMQFHQKFPDVTVAVGEERLVAIPQLLHDRPETEVIILDDAFQHRSIRAGLNIILTEYKNLYTRDFLLPAGDLRDVTYSSNRADIIVISKCKPSLSMQERYALVNEIQPLPHQQVFFTRIVYGNPYEIFSKSEIQLDAHTDVLLVCGIANPRPLKDLLNATVRTYDMIRYADHHIFSSDDLADIKKQYRKIKTSRKIIITTEKDAVRLQKFKQELHDLPIYVIPIRHEFLFNEADLFKETILRFVKPFMQDKSNA